METLIEVPVNAVKAMCHMHLRTRVTHMRRARLRIWLATKLIKCGAWLISAEVVVEEKKD